MPLPPLAGMFARLYMDRYGVTPEHLAMVAIKNHANGVLNPKAHLRVGLTMEGLLTGPDAAMNNPFVAEPLRFFDCCPVSDGASAVLLAPAAMAKQFKKTPVRIAGIGQATDLHAVHARPDPTEIPAVRWSTRACRRAWSWCCNCATRPATTRCRASRSTASR